MNTKTNPRASAARKPLQRAALLGAKTKTLGLAAAILIFAACGGGGGGSPSAPAASYTATSVSTCANGTALSATSAVSQADAQTAANALVPSGCPALSPAPTVSVIGGVLTLSKPAGAVLVASTLTVNPGGTLVVPLTLAVSAAGVITPVALPCGGAGQLLCSTSYPVTGTLNFTNAPSAMISTSVTTPAAPVVCNAVTATTYQQLVGPNCVTVNRATNTTTGSPNKVSATNLQLIAATLIGDTQWNSDINAGKVLWFELQNLGGGTPTHIVSWYLRPNPFVTPTAANPNPTMACDKPIEIATGATTVSQGTSAACDGNTQDYGVANNSAFVKKNFDVLNNVIQCGQKNFDLGGNWAGSTFSGSSSICTP